MSSATAVSARPRRSALANVWAFVRRHVLTAYSILFFIYLMLRSRKPVPGKVPGAAH